MLRSVIVARMAALADRGVLGRKPERVVAHRAQHRVAVPAAEVGDDVAERVVLDVPHVELARGVRQHLEHVRALLLERRRREAAARDSGTSKARSAAQTACHLALDGLRVVAIHQSSDRSGPVSAAGLARGTIRPISRGQQRHPSATVRARTASAKWSQGDSNPRPSGCQPDALPAELWPRDAFQSRDSLPRPEALGRRSPSRRRARPTARRPRAARGGSSRAPRA